MRPITLPQWRTPHIPLFGHPPGLYVLFATEMWERFSFYGMRALLTLYLTKHFIYSDSHASGIFGAYAGLTYALPVLGGFLADRYMGARRGVIYGGILLCLGHLAMAFEGVPAVQAIDGSVTRDHTAEAVLFLALALIATGVGFLKPNISTLVGSLYHQADNRRDSGFTLFYMGINIGAFVATLAVGYLGEEYGWRYGFGLAGIGMIIGLAVFLWGQKHLNNQGAAPDEELLKKPLLFQFTRAHLIYAFGAVLVVASWYLLQFTQVVGIGIFLTLLATYLYLLIDSLLHCTRAERARLLVVLILIFFSVIFWSLFEQAGTSMTHFTDRVVDRTIWGVELKTSNFQSLNPAFIILLAPLFAGFWVWLAHRGWEPGLPVKFALGIIQAGLGFWMLVIGINMGHIDGSVAVIWLALAYLLHTTGELCLSPVGLSMITRLTAPRMVGLMMGNWFLATAFASWLASQLAKIAAIDVSVVQQGDVEQMFTTYQDLFNSLGWMGLIFGVILLALNPILKKMSGGY